MTGHKPAGDPQRSGGQASVLNRCECAALLRVNQVGRIGFLNDGWPAILPVNYVMDGDDIVIRTDSGTKFAALRHGAEISFEVDAIDPLYRSGWSVLVYGNAAEVEDVEELQQVKSLRLRAWHQGTKPFWIRIAPVLVTGRRLPKAWQYPDPTES
jgi:nitroimidazol reductase NimA-like FMN-containing flavoprotein (pyridoxamine 5'-phosphate oxidase superfamily)